jgi:hypothetical protein
MTLDALSSCAHCKEHGPVFPPDGFTLFALLFVKMMCRGIVFLGTVTLKTQGVSFFYRGDAVYVVTIAAANIAMVHFALSKGPVNVYFL